MGRVHVIRRAEYLTARGLFWWGAAAGFVCFLVVGLVGAGLDIILGILDIVVLAIVASVAALGMPAWLFARVRSRIATARRAAWCGVGFGAGLMLVPLWVWIFGAVIGDDAKLALPGLGVSVVCSLAYGALALGAGLLCFGTGAEVVIQEGTICPGCGYSLIGNTTMICPECGRRFTFEELETTEEEFRRRHTDWEPQINTDEHG